jgi:hypothetical protein
MKHVYISRLNQLGAKVIKNLPKNHDKAKNKPDFIVWDDGL